MICHQAPIKILLCLSLLFYPTLSWAANVPFIAAASLKFALQEIASAFKQAQAGLIAYSLALTPPLKNNTRYILSPHDAHQPLAQTMVLLNNAGETAKQFYPHLQQVKAQDILSDYGFTTP